MTTLSGCRWAVRVRMSPNALDQVEGQGVRSRTGDTVPPMDGATPRRCWAGAFGGGGRESCPLEGQKVVSKKKLHYLIMRCDSLFIRTVGEEVADGRRLPYST